MDKKENNQAFLNRLVMAAIFIIIWAGLTYRLLKTGRHGIFNYMDFFPGAVFPGFHVLGGKNALQVFEKPGKGATAFI